MGRLRYPSQDTELTLLEIEELLDELECLNREYTEIVKELSALMSEARGLNKTEDRERILEIIRESKDKLEDTKEMDKRIKEITAILSRAGILTVGQLTKRIKTISV